MPTYNAKDYTIMYLVRKTFKKSNCFSIIILR